MRRQKVKKFQSIFAKYLSDFIEMKIQAGFKFTGQTVILENFDRFLSNMNYQGALTQELVMNFLTSTPGLSEKWSTRKYHVLQQFSVYLSYCEPDMHPLPVRRKATKKAPEKKYRSIFADHISNFIELRKRMGSQFEQQTSILALFDHYLCDLNYQGQLTQELALNFATSNLQMSRNGCVRKYQVVRLFANYLSAFIPDTPLLSLDVLKQISSHAPAHIYTDEEIARLMNGARHVSRLNPIRNVTFYTIIGLAASTGLRISEVVRLNRADVNLETGILTVRQSKFQKDRLVPVHPTTLKVLRDYVLVRDARFIHPDTPAFFISMWGKRFCSRTISGTFTKLTRSVGVRDAVGNGPHFHDLRHTFAVRRLVTWYREDKDVQTMLPFLATYMGHVHYRDTAYYLKATAELLGLAAEKYDAFIKKGSNYE